MRAPIAALLVLAACERGPAKPDPRPPNLIVDVARSSSTSLDGLRAFVDAIQPGAGAMLDEAKLLRPLDGIDLTKPMHLLVVDRGDERGVVVLAKIGDQKVLDTVQSPASIEKRNGWALIGKQPFLRDVTSYAFSTLVTAPAPAKPTATVYLPRVLALHAKEVDKGREQFGAGMTGSMAVLMQGYFDALLSIARDTDEVRATLDASGAQGAIDLAFAPRPGSRLAAFIAAQKPGDFSLLAKLPDESAAMVIAGHLVLGPYHDGFVAAMAAIYQIPATSIAKELEAIMNAANGDIAMTVRLGGGMAMTQLIGMRDVAAANTALDRIHDKLGAGMKLDMGTTSATLKAIDPAVDHDGVKLRRFDVVYDVSSAPPAQQQVAAVMVPPGSVMHDAIGAFDHWLVFAMGADSGTQVIDSVRGKGAHYTPSPEVTTLLDAARKAGDSIAMILDPSSLLAMMRGSAAAPAPMLMSIGGGGGQLHLRIVMTTSSVRALIPR